MLWGYCYVIVAGDLSSSQKAVQGIHASVESANAGFLKEPHNLVFCSVPSSQDLNNLCSLLELKSIDHKTFIEPDLDNKLTAIATKVVFGDDRKHFSNLKLVRL